MWFYCQFYEVCLRRSLIRRTLIRLSEPVPSLTLVIHAHSAPLENFGTSLVCRHCQAQPLQEIETLGRGSVGSGRRAESDAHTACGCRGRTAVFWALTSRAPASRESRKTNPRVRLLELTTDRSTRIIHSTGPDGANQVDLMWALPRVSEWTRNNVSGPYRQRQPVVAITDLIREASPRSRWRRNRNTQERAWVTAAAYRALAHGPQPREPCPMGPQPRELQPIDISLYKSLAIVLNQALLWKWPDANEVIFLTINCGDPDSLIPMTSPSIGHRSSSFLMCLNHDRPFSS